MAVGVGDTPLSTKVSTAACLQKYATILARLLKITPSVWKQHIKLQRKETG